MSYHEYTPTTGRVRHCATHEDAWLSFQPESFDRWLAEHDAETRTAALEEAAGIADGIDDDALYPSLIGAAIRAAKEKISEN